MNRTYTTQSLLPWLDPGSSRIRLEFSLKSASLNGGGKDDVPFRCLESFSPIFDLQHGTYRSPSGKIVKNVFLLVQKDGYTFSDPNPPFGNPEIDAIWLSAVNFDSTSFGLEALDSLASSLGDEPILPLWRSLFFCEKRNCYFHPPCPECGELLELCEWDDILLTAGLPLYSKSLERFLFCPACQAAHGNSDFYTNKAGDFPHMVKSRQDLVAGFEHLAEEGLGGTDFPCRGCSEKDDCYGSGYAYSRIKPFSFYPFRMLVTDAAPLPAKDFIAMLSGATIEELQQQAQLMRRPERAACLDSFQQQATGEIKLFFADEPKSFLEILYLKIVFLKELAQLFFMAGKQLSHPDFQLSMEQVWVELPDYQGLLPFFWNFKVKPVALGIFPMENLLLVKVPESLGLYSLALCWFQTLLVNGKQSAKDVHQSIAASLNGKDDSDSMIDPFSEKGSEAGAFAPANIFYRPATRQLPDQWQELWQRALDCGWSLLKASTHSKEFSESLFIDDLTELATVLKRELFTSNAVKSDLSLSIQATAKGSDPEDVSEVPWERVDSDILQVLLGIRKKWRLEDENTEQKQDVVSDGEVPASEPIDVEEEVVGQEDQLEKTVILSADQVAAMMVQDDPKEPPPADEDVTGEAAEDAPGVDDSGEDGLLKTIIVNSDDMQSMLAAEQTAAPSESQKTVLQSENSVDEDLSETVIISLEELEKLRKGK